MFKEKDIVKIKSCTDPDSWIKEMNETLGLVGVVQQTAESVSWGDIALVKTENNRYYWYAFDELELLESRQGV